MPVSSCWVFRLRRRPGPGDRGAVEGTSSLILGDVLAGIYTDLGLERLRDEAFGAVALAGVIEPISKAGTVRVLNGIGEGPAHRVTFRRCLRRVVERD
jgi:hypothetical protein